MPSELTALPSLSETALTLNALVSSVWSIVKIRELVELAAKLDHHFSF